MLPFAIDALDPGSRARRGLLTTAHGAIPTPAFMPVGTRASVTGMTARDLDDLEPDVILANTYHLMLRPGDAALRTLGGIHRLMNIAKPVLTDSGGYQIFSLGGAVTVAEEGARFQSYVDHRYELLTPERAIAMQEAIGSDIMMVLDHCVPSTADEARVADAVARTRRWALRSLAARQDERQGLFAIVQGGVVPALRERSAGELCGHPFDGFAIGGLAVGEERSRREEVTASTVNLLPRDRPRYLMGVGTPADILIAVGLGVDMFDCILPTTLTWQGVAFTSTGRVRVTRSAYRLDESTLDAACTCMTCRRHSRAYLHHLIKSREPVGPRLLAIHNLTHYLELMRAARQAITEGRYAEFARAKLSDIDRHEHAPK